MTKSNNRCLGVVTWGNLRTKWANNSVTHLGAYLKSYYLVVLNGQDPLNNSRWHTWRPPQDPGQSLGLLHSLSLVLATTFGCPNGQQHANLSSFLIISVTAAASPRLHSSSSVRKAPWLAQINFSISNSILRTHGFCYPLTVLKGNGVQNICCWFRLWSLETETKGILF